VLEIVGNFSYDSTVVKELLHIFTTLFGECMFQVSTGVYVYKCELLKITFKKMGINVFILVVTSTWKQ